MRLQDFEHPTFYFLSDSLTLLRFTFASRINIINAAAQCQNAAKQERAEDRILPRFPRPAKAPRRSAKPENPGSPEQRCMSVYAVPRSSTGTRSATMALVVPYAIP